MLVTQVCYDSVSILADNKQRRLGPEEDGMIMVLTPQAGRSLNCWAMATPAPRARRVNDFILSLWGGRGEREEEDTGLEAV